MCEWGSANLPFSLSLLAQGCSSLCLRLHWLSVLDWVGWGKPEAANQHLGLEKCLEAWTVSLETFTHLERTSLPAQFTSSPLPPFFSHTPLPIALPPPSNFSTSLLPPWSSGSHCSCISPAACLHLQPCMCTDILVLTAPPPCRPLPWQPHTFPRKMSLTEWTFYSKVGIERALGIVNWSKRSHHEGLYFSAGGQLPLVWDILVIS